ncbi:2TM domain-containing protein [Flavobacterium sp. F-380]|uniref:2TM domain-containing protein n=1 Tax=Flavobacterium kayseriense TaxID=2764714 RepID=A0ABR7J9N5_9FLAO|nr:2TM domain-containing protein [Flavobacterium kayseriense]MBC5842265.1 2TM domain-containing protein [Flavobacterium kayseriense]MBC5848795.1 2TM domain-containing protein [Flavobacterium kayseriense]
MNINRFLKEFPRAFFISLSIFVVLLIIDVLNGGVIKFDNHLKINFLYTMLYGMVLYYSNACLYIYLDTFFESRKYSIRRIVVGFLSSFFLSLFVIFLLRIFEDVVIEGGTLSDFLTNEKPANYIVATITTFVILLGIHLIYFYKAYNENKVKEQKIIAGTANAKFESLKNQIDPHFLFNSLNVLSSLIEENPDNAQRFTTSLSKVYRYVLEQKDKELVSIEEELTFAKTYMNLLKMRFEDSLEYELKVINPDPEAKVVPLSLQLLLENAVKHNVISAQRPLQIRIYIENGFLVIQNDYQKKEVLQDRQGVGLQNIISRYAIITKRKVIIEQNEKTFTVKIPILTKQTTVMEAAANYNENNAYFRAKKRVEELKGFYGNLISYCCVIPFLIFINLKFSPQFHWFWFSALGWGFGLTMHALQVFGYGKNWEERKIQEILEKDTSKQKWK